MLTRSSARARPLCLQIGDYIEVLREDSDSRGRWFVCKVLRLPKKRVQVLLCDRQNLKEWVPVKLAAKDQLGMRLDRRMNIRPCPQWDPLHLRFEVGKPVDVWWRDCWCEGVMIRKHQSANVKIEVYLPGENKFMTFKRTDIRLSKEWFNCQWTSLDAKPDILSSISSLNEKSTKKRPIEETLPKDRPPLRRVLALECPGAQSSSVMKKRKRTSKKSYSRLN